MAIAQWLQSDLWGWLSTHPAAGFSIQDANNKKKGTRGCPSHVMYLQYTEKCWDWLLFARKAQYKFLFYSQLLLLHLATFNCLHRKRSLCLEFSFWVFPRCVHAWFHVTLSLTWTNPACMWQTFMLFLHIFSSECFCKGGWTKTSYEGAIDPVCMPLHAKGTCRCCPHFLSLRQDR